MNIIKKAYCRTFQGACRLALPILPYCNPRILHSMDEVPDVLVSRRLHRPLLVTDQSIHGLGLTRELEDILTERRMAPVVYDGTRPNPTSDMVLEALKLYRSNNCDCIIAFGGGSPMDCAKAVGACAARPGKQLYQMSGLLKVTRKIPDLIAIPTTAGTGSETTLAAVIVDSETRHKYVINDFALIPPYTVLDPSVIHSLPASVAAETGLDALTHAVEAYIGRSTTPGTRKDARRAVKLIFENLEDACAHTSSKAEKNMLVAAHLAGRAFTRSYVGYIHAVSHSLSGKYDLPHGRTNATLLPLVLEMYLEKTPASGRLWKKLADLAVCAGIGTEEEDSAELARRFIGAIYDFNKKLGIPEIIEEIREEDLDTLAAYADHEANPLYPVPVLWGKEELKEIYRKVRG